MAITSHFLMFTTLLNTVSGKVFEEVCQLVNQFFLQSNSSSQFVTEVPDVSDTVVSAVNF
jgi:hypothetical protein